jgi:hypothetical protein
LARPRPAFTADVPTLHEEAASAGIDQSYTGGWEFFRRRGCGEFRCNGDRSSRSADCRRSLAGGKVLRQRKRNRRPAGLQADANRIEAGRSDRVLGAYPLDIDNDRHTDLVLLRLGRNLVLKGGPDCRFEKANRNFSIDGGGRGRPACRQYGKRATAFRPSRSAIMSTARHRERPFGTCEPNQLLRPGTGRSRLFGCQEAAEPGHCALSMLFTDWNRSGSPISGSPMTGNITAVDRNSFGICQGRPPRLYTASQGWQRLTVWGMGIAETDFDADGLPEYALTSMGDTKLQKLDEEAGEDRPTYRDIAFELGATAHRPYAGGDSKPSTGWHSEFARFQQRHEDRPLHRQGQCSGDARFRQLRSGQSAAGRI